MGSVGDNRVCMPLVYAEALRIRSCSLRPSALLSFTAFLLLLPVLLIYFLVLTLTCTTALRHLTSLGLSFLMCKMKVYYMIFQSVFQ